MTRKVRAFLGGNFCRRKERRSMRRKQTTALGCPTREHARQGLRNSPLVRLLAPLTHLPLPTHSLPLPPSIPSRSKLKELDRSFQFILSIILCTNEVHKVYPQLFIFFRRKTFLVITAVISIRFWCTRNWQRTRNWRKQRNGLPTVLFFFSQFKTTINEIKTLLFWEFQFLPATIPSRHTLQLFKFKF